MPMPPSTPTMPAEPAAAEQTFFADPAIDRVLAVTLQLAGEVWVLRDQLAAMRGLLAERGVLDHAALEAHDLGPGAAEDRDAFVAHIMDSLFGRAASRGAQG